MKRLLAWTFMTTFAAACGGNVSVDQRTTSSGGGTDTGGMGGTGGIGGTGGTGTTGTTSVKICGGKQGTPCSVGEWCQFDPPGSCGAFDNTGICQPAPSGCTADCPGVCACNGTFFCNACEAHGAGLDTSNDIACGQSFDGGVAPDEYKAYMLPTNAPRYAISKAEYSANRCLLIVVAGFGNNFPNIDSTMGWNVESIAITPDVNDCTMGLGWPPPPTAIKTDIAKGILKQDSTMWPCSVDIDIAVGFPPGSPSWVPSQDTAQAFGLIVSGGGCGI